MWAGQVFEWAVENGHAQINPAALISPAKAFGKSPVVSFAALDLRDVPENKVRAVYNRSAYLDERRRMLQSWADWFESCGK